MSANSISNCKKRVLPGSILALGVAMFLWSGVAWAKVTAITITSTTPLTGDYGTAGSYELIRGTADGEIDPSDSHNTIITDIDLAVKNPNGKVGYTATFAIAKPVDMSKASGVLFYETSNRGSGNPMGGWPYLTGGVYLLSGWQGDLPTNSVNRVTVPIAKNPDGSSIKGVALARMTDMTKGTTTQTLNIYTRNIPYDSSMDKTKATLRKKVWETRAGENGPIVEVPATDWEFADCSTVPFPGTADPRKLCVKGGYDPMYLYEMSYEVKDPYVLGVGMAAWRDVSSFFRYETADSKGTANPLSGRITHALAEGVSQAGWAIKTFVQLGFNQDENNRVVYDAVNTHIAGAVLPINVRFAVLSGGLSMYEPGSEAVQWWAKAQDIARGREKASLYDRCRASDTCPKVVETFGSAELYGRVLSFMLHDTSDEKDIPLRKNIRFYYFPGTSHGGGGGGFTHKPSTSSSYVLATNPNPETQTLQALQAAMVDWVVSGTEMPASKYPTISSGELVRNRAKAMGWPKIPDVPTPTCRAIGLLDYDYGSSFNYNDLSGVITNQPPEVKQVLTALVPRVDKSGNETAGVPSLLHKVPLGTYTGWNMYASTWFKDQVPGLVGGYIPFAKTKEERLVSGDSRPSLQELYGLHSGYMCKLRKAAAKMVKQRYLRQADADKLIAQADATPNLPLTGTTQEQKIANKCCK
ncbi:MAG: alpha/beta hydrolase domain-containing protein [Syntrophobacter sp.]